MSEIYAKVPCSLKLKINALLTFTSIMPSGEILASIIKITTWIPFIFNAGPHRYCNSVCGTLWLTKRILIMIAKRLCCFELCHLIFSKIVTFHV